MPTGSSFPAAKNLSKLEGDQVGHRCILSLSSCPLLRCIMGQDECRSLALGSRKSRKRKKPTQVQPPLEGAACMGCNRVCFTHPYYNKVEKLVACSIGNNQKIICTFISCSKILNCWLSVLFATNAVDLSSRLLV